MGFEPTASWATTRRSNQLSYTHRKFMARLRGFEPLTYGLEVRCSIQLSYRRLMYKDQNGKHSIGNQKGLSSRKFYQNSKFEAVS